jgi:hypothetical protein
VALAPPSTEELIAPKWSPDWNEETLVLAYAAAEGVRDVQAGWADALDAKIMALFGVGSAILVVVPTLKTPDTLWARVLWVVAALMWLASCWNCYVGFKPAPFRLGPDPSVLVGEDWLGRSPPHFRLWRMSSMGKSYLHNSAVLSAKGTALRAALWFTAAEVLALTAGLFVAGIGTR